MLGSSLASSRLASSLAQNLTDHILSPSTSSNSLVRPTRVACDVKNQSGDRHMEPPTVSYACRGTRFVPPSRQMRLRMFRACFNTPAVNRAVRRNSKTAAPVRNPCSLSGLCPSPMQCMDGWVARWVVLIVNLCRETAWHAYAACAVGCWLLLGTFRRLACLPMLLA